MPMYDYFCSWCEHTTTWIGRYEERPEKVKCEHCDDYPAEYKFSAPGQIRIGFEQNGRKGVKIDMGGGKKLHRSMTRENYEHNMGNISAKDYKDKNYLDKRKLNESSFTKGYQEHLNKKKEKKNATD